MDCLYRLIQLFYSDRNLCCIVNELQINTTNLTNLNIVISKYIDLYRILYDYAIKCDRSLPLLEPNEYIFKSSQLNIIYNKKHKELGDNIIDDMLYQKIKFGEDYKHIITMNDYTLTIKYNFDSIDEINKNIMKNIKKTNGMGSVCNIKTILPMNMDKRDANEDYIINTFRDYVNANAINVNKILHKGFVYISNDLFVWNICDLDSQFIPTNYVKMYIIDGFYWSNIMLKQLNKKKYIDILPTIDEQIQTLDIYYDSKARYYNKFIF
jgi:hypothetical protein